MIYIYIYEIFLLSCIYWQYQHYGIWSEWWSAVARNLIFKESGFQYCLPSICPFSVSGTTGTEVETFSFPLFLPQLIQVKAERHRKDRACISIARKGNQGKIVTVQRLTTRSKRTMEKWVENITFCRQNHISLVSDSQYSFLQSWLKW